MFPTQSIAMATERIDMSRDGEDQPLVEYPYYDEDGYSIYSENTTKRRQLLRYSSYAAATVVGLPLLWFFLIYLPNLAPPGIDIPQIYKVRDSKVYLRPLVPVYAHSEGFAKISPDFDDFDFVPEDDELFAEHIEALEIDISKRPVRRMIIIGDVHGSLKQLQKLLNKVRYDPARDEVVLLGDFISKGKDSLGVLEYAINNEFACILGNHELEVLKRYSQFHGVASPSFNHSTFESLAFSFDEEMRLAKRLEPEHVSYLAECPLISKLGPVPHMNKFQTHYLANPLHGLAVHGGLIWNTTLEDQDPEVVTTVRSLLPPDFKKPTDDPHEKGSQPWSRYWNKYQRQLYKAADKKKTTKPIGTMVYYGHDAKRGIKYKEYTTGLDSGCVYGGKLSAEIVWSEVKTKSDGTKKIVYQKQPVQVKC